MSNRSAVWGITAMREMYGEFYRKSSIVKLDAASVPLSLQSLIPYASFWGISDDYARDQLVMSAPQHALLNLVSVVRQFDDDLDTWLAGPEAEQNSFTDEYIAFSAMRMAGDLAAVRSTGPS